MPDSPWFVPLVATLALACAGFATCLVETRAVRAWRRWPFRSGLVAVRFRTPATAFRPERTGLARGIAYRVVGPTECIFAERGWAGELRWTDAVSPFRLKGHASWTPSGVEVVGRVSLGVCVTLPAVGLWLAGCGLVGWTRSPTFFSIFVAVGLGLPILGTWLSLPREIAAFRSAWTSVADELAP